MTEMPHGADGYPETPETHGSAAVEATGHAEVDAVLDSLRGLEDAPVSDHVGVFERAHDRLRSALADAGEGPA